MSGLKINAMKTKIMGMTRKNVILEYKNLKQVEPFKYLWILEVQYNKLYTGFLKNI